MRSPRMPSSVELVARSRRVVHRVIHRVRTIINEGSPSFADRRIEFEALLLIPHLRRLTHPTGEPIQPLGHTTVTHLGRVVHGSIDLADLAGIHGIDD